MEINRYIDRTEPWRLAKHAADCDRLATVLVTSLEALRQVAVMILPAMPRTSAAILRHLGFEPAADGDWETRRWDSLAADHVVPSGPPLFPRLDPA